jgi:molecular chaperone IbpA
MRTVFDFSPLWRSSIGFDRMVDLLDEATRFEPSENYPPYNIEKTGEDAYRITLAVAGFTPDELTITAEPNLLAIGGKKAEGQSGEYLYQGIAGGTFEVQFRLADHVKVTGAKLEQGLLVIELVREVPEAMKPRRIAIDGGPALKAVESKHAA